MRAYGKPLLLLGTRCDLDLAKHDVGYVNERTMRIRGAESVEAGDYLYATPLTTPAAVLRVMSFLTPPFPGGRWTATCSDRGALVFRSVPACALRVSGPLASYVGLGVNGTGAANVPTSQWVTAPPTDGVEPAAVAAALQFAFDRFTIRRACTLALSDVMGRRYDVVVAPGMYSHDSFCARLSSEASRAFGCRLRFYVDDACVMHAEGDRPFGVEWPCCSGDLARRTGFDPVPMRGRREYHASRPCGTATPPTSTVAPSAKAAVMRVSIMPKATTLARMPSGPHSRACVLVSPITPALAAA